MRIEVNLEVAGDADASEIAALMNRAYRGSGDDAGWTTEGAYLKGDRTSEPQLRAEIAENPAASFLIWREGQNGALKGCVWLAPLGEHIWYLGSLAVDPKQQKSGEGHALFAAAEQWARDRGGKGIRLSVINVRDTLIAWYERRGYRKTGETKPFPYGDDRFGIPLRDDLAFVVLAKAL